MAHTEQEGWPTLSRTGITYHGDNTRKENPPGYSRERYNPPGYSRRGITHPGDAEGRAKTRLFLKKREKGG